MDINEALNELLGDNRTGDLDQDLVLAGNEIRRIRERNTLLGGVVLATMIDREYSYRKIEAATGISKSTVQRWAQPPPD